jgi:phage FluMu protein Com
MDSSGAQSPTAEIHQSEEDDDEKKKLPIKTYHCRFCSHLLIASTRELLSSRTPLPRRRQLSTIEAGGGGAGGEGVGGLDGAMILELPSSKTSRTNRKRKSYDGEERGDTMLSGPGPEKEAAGTAPAVPQAAAAPSTENHGGRKTEQAHYTIPLSTLLPDAAPIIIRREDGFEKRVLLRCGRCRVVVGYKLPSENTATAPTAEEEGDDDEDEDDDDENGLTTKGKREKAIYLLPGSIVGTEDLDVGLTEVDGTGGGRGGGDALNAMIDRNPVLKGMEREWMEWVK